MTLNLWMVSLSYFVKLLPFWNKIESCVELHSINATGLSRNLIFWGKLSKLKHCKVLPSTPNLDSLSKKITMDKALKAAESNRRIINKYNFLFLNFKHSVTMQIEQYIIINQNQK